ncbi:hypothetical protein [Clostridium sp. DJ247]|uniref:hypothetical protein n=1 Tax=Clostridium sp. DJ247 TaxID=2726188 RepID=UPI00162AB2A8|nr:hypothetical protein [Clostridium sp. DJ247]MBC2582643.1 hypothetical protein [Clostridium sp. DJ247]
MLYQKRILRYFIDILPANYNDLVNSLLGILVVAGILSNPQTENKGYLDDKINMLNNKKDNNWINEQNKK